MDEWEALRAVATVVVWVTVLGGLVMAIIWIAAGGARAIGPEDELMAESGIVPRGGRRRFTSFSSAQVGLHGLLGLTTAALLTYAAARDDDRASGYIAVLVTIVITVVPGALMFRTWRSGARPQVPAVGAAVDEPRPEDRIPGVVAYLHGLAALATVGLIVALLVLD